MSLLPIRYVSFDCYGTLIDFQVGNVARDRLAARVPAGRMTAFLEDFTAYRFDEVLGAWKPYPEVLHRSLERTCRRWGIAFDPADAQAIVEAVPTWGPHADVPAALAKVAEVLPLVILSNAADSQIRSNVDKLGADKLGSRPSRWCKSGWSLRWPLVRRPWVEVSPDRRRSAAV